LVTFSGFGITDQEKCGNPDPSWYPVDLPNGVLPNGVSPNGVLPKTQMQRFAGSPVPQMTFYST
jgi:hypothetical protein